MVIENKSHVRSFSIPSRQLMATKAITATAPAINAPPLDVEASRAARKQHSQDRYRTRSGLPIPNNRNGGQNSLLAVLLALDVTKGDNGPNPASSSAVGKKNGKGRASMASTSKKRASAVEGESVAGMFHSISPSVLSLIRIKDHQRLLLHQSLRNLEMFQVRIAQRSPH